MTHLRLSAEALRRELCVRNLERARTRAHETTYGRVPSVIYTDATDAGDDGKEQHGNFLDASYRRIVADEAWRQRLAKAYTAGGRVARRHDRRRGELECATSSDALLMNVFCYPGATSRRPLCGMLGVDAGLRPEFGVRVHVPLAGGLTDRTEVDMRLGDTLVEAKLTEGGFQTARAALVGRYRDLDEVFAVKELPRRGELFAAYQVVRGVLAAHARGERFLLIADGRRADLAESWLGVVRAVRSCEMRSRLGLATWQEIAGTMPAVVQAFLAEKYGIIRSM